MQTRWRHWREIFNTSQPKCILPPSYNHPETFMPGWGTNSFENDDAQNFLAALSTKQPTDLKQILSQAAGHDSYLQAPEASIAIAAAEVVAIATGNSPQTIPRQIEEQIQEWIGKIEGAPSAEMLELARRAVNKVRLNSELKDLWLQAEGLNDWSRSLRDLEERHGDSTGSAR
jgi:hypothetical protein